MKHSLQAGFTLIELLVVIAVVGVLAGGIIAIINPAGQIEKAKYAQVKSEMAQIKNAMLQYKVLNGELPPPGDNCSGCSNPPNSSWTIVIDYLVNGGYLKQRIEKDPWGNYFGYDDNDCNSNPGQSPLFTAGTDGTNGTADDYQIIVTDSC